jgi:hypothetical protein
MDAVAEARQASKSINLLALAVMEMSKVVLLRVTNVVAG